MCVVGGGVVFSCHSGVGFTDSDSAATSDFFFFSSPAWQNKTNKQRKIVHFTP